MEGVTEIMVTEPAGTCFPASLNLFTLNGIPFTYETERCFYDSGSLTLDLINEDLMKKLFIENNMIFKERYLGNPIKILGNVVYPRYIVKCRIKIQKDDIIHDVITHLIPIPNLPFDCLISQKTGKDLEIKVMGLPNRFPIHDVQEELAIYCLEEMEFFIDGKEIDSSEVLEGKEEFIFSVEEETELLLTKEFKEELDKGEIPYSIEEAELELQGSLIADEIDDEEIVKEISNHLKRNEMNPEIVAKTTPIKLPLEENKLKQPKQYPVAEKHKEMVTQQVKDWLEKGYIRKSNSVKFPLNLVVVPKYCAQTGKQLDQGRLCIDCRPINECINQSKTFYRLPNIKSILEETKDAEFITELDLREAYNSFLLDKTTSEYINFQWNGCKYECVTACFGLNIMPSLFQQRMEEILYEEIQSGQLSIYIDNLLIYSKSRTEHIEILKKVIDKLTKFNLHLNTKKLKIGRKCIRSLGFIFSKNGIGIDPSKLEKVKNYERPRTVAQLRAFLGLINYFRSHIYRLSEVEHVLNQMRSGNRRDLLEWNKERIEAFEKLKILLHKSPILHRPDYSQRFYLTTDGSINGIGASLFQIIKRGEKSYKKLIGFTSRSLTPAEKSYDSQKIELLALLHAVEKYRPIILGMPTTILTDNRSLLAIQKSSSKLKSRWVEKINEVLSNAEIIHIDGTRNVLSDLLSRLGLNNEILLSQELKEIKDENEKMDLIKKYHVASNHRGYKEVMERIKTEAKCYWKNMNVDIINFRKECETCLQFDKSEKLYHSPKSHYAVNNLDWQVMDTLGPLEASSEGYRYILVVVDVSSKFTWIRPLRDKTAEEVARVLVLIWAGYGAALKISSDNGTEFANQVLEEICKQLLIEKRHITAHNPSANGLAEAYVKTVRYAIKKMVKEEEYEIQGVKYKRYVHEWPYLLPQIEVSLNTRKGPSGYSSFFRLFGREFQSESLGEKILSEEELIERWKHINSKLFPDIKEVVKRVAENTSKRVEERRKLILESPIPIGSIVMLMKKENDIKDKMDSIFEGPYRVSNAKGKDGSYSYLLTHLEDREMIIERNAAVSRLKIIKTPAIEQIKDFKKIKKQTYYLVKFKETDQELWIEDDNPLLKGKIEKFLKEKNIQG